MKLLLILIISLSVFADYSSYQVDDKETHEKTKVKMISGKKDSNRFYQGNLSQVFSHPFEKVVIAVSNFTEKCNNELKDKRELTDKKYECPYHNTNLVESKVYKVTKDYKKEENETDRYLIARRIYNRSSFSHMDLVRVYETKNVSGKRVLTITQEMLTDKKANALVDNPLDQDSAFQKAFAKYTITEIDNKSTILNYYYASETDHWLLNKSISVGKVFDSMGASIGLLFDSISKKLEGKS